MADLQALIRKSRAADTAASWAIDFYRRNGFTVVADADKDSLQGKYWSIPARQAETSAVLADQRWMDARR